MNTPLSLCLWILTFATLMTHPSHAELAPSVYRSMQAKAPEAIQIHITARDSSRLGFFNFSGDRKERLEATVVSVTRSKSGLKVGDKIVISYLHKKLRGVGPRPIPILQKDQKYPAWLTKKGDLFLPAARGASFSLVQ